MTPGQQAKITKIYKRQVEPSKNSNCNINKSEAYKGKKKKTKA